MPRLLSILLLPFLLASCSDQYWSYHASKERFQTETKQVAESLGSFSVDRIEPRDVEILSTPDTQVLDRIVAKIDSAKKRVYLEVYILTEKRIQKALRDAKSRNVDVRVILERGVFGAGSINKKAFDSLAQAWVTVTYADNKKYVFTHTKTFVIDDEYIIGTGNMSYSSFTTNREFFVVGQNKQDLDALVQIFEADQTKQDIAEDTSNLVISPFSSRTKIEQTLRSASGSIFLYAETFSDASIVNILAEKAKNGAKIAICIADPKKIPANTEDINKLRSVGLDVRTSKKPTIHAKAFLVDGKYMYIGSENFTENSLDRNREIGILLRSDTRTNENFQGLFKKDCPGK